MHGDVSSWDADTADNHFRWRALIKKFNPCRKQDREGESGHVVGNIFCLWTLVDWTRKLPVSFIFRTRTWWLKIHFWQSTPAQSSAVAPITGGRHDVNHEIRTCPKRQRQRDASEPVLFLIQEQDQKTRRNPTRQYFFLMSVRGHGLTSPALPTTQKEIPRWLAACGGTKKLEMKMSRFSAAAKFAAE